MSVRLDAVYVDMVEYTWSTTGHELTNQQKMALRARLELHLAMSAAAGLRFGSQLTR